MKFGIICITMSGNAYSAVKEETRLPTDTSALSENFIILFRACFCNYTQSSRSSPLRSIQHLDVLCIHPQTVHDLIDGVAIEHC